LQPKVSIIIPTFNSASTLAETLDSVFCQTYFDWECVVVDDGSIDFTEQIVKGYIQKDIRFHFYKRPDTLPKGPSSARNFGVTKATGEYLLFLDADDLLASACLENRITEFEQHKDSDFLVFQMERFQTEPDFSKKEVTVEQDKNRILESFIHLHGQWPITSPIYKTVFFKEKIDFNPNLIVFEDLEVAIKSVLSAKNFIIYNTIDCYYRNDENYKVKYNSLAVKTKMVKSFQKFILSVTKIIEKNPEHQFKNADIKSYLLQSYKKFFRFYILENSREFKEDNKTTLQLLATNFFLSKTEILKFYFVDRILLPFATIKGSGISRLIKFIYN